ncbi:MAG: helix-turn-helix domain-containing protein [Lentisphaeraceae bacterium]|nr:helix-turn-helix domain-containing protein [Lentisphaeraceae bacterium]
MSELTGTLPKALLILEYMAEHPQDVSFKDLKNFTGFASNVLSRLLKTFVEKGYIEKSSMSGLYSLGKNSYRFCENVLGRRSVSDLIQPILDGLSAGLQESSAYFDFDGEWVTLLAKSEVAHSYHYLEVNSRDVHSPINGFFLTCLPYLGDSQVKNILSNENNRAGFSRDELMSKFVKIKEMGVYISKEVHHRSQVTRVSAPVFCDQKKKLAGALGVTVLSHGLTDKELKLLITAVTSAANNASLMLSGEM